MKGLELSKRYYETFGIPMIKEKFPDYESRIAVGLVGEGSECFGFDDEISKDHDFEPSFCMWLTKEDYSRIGEQLQREYEQLPKEFCGITRQNSSHYGQNRRGVKVIGQFYEQLLGNEEGPQDFRDWLLTPEYSLACAVNGEVFRDDLGEFTAIRNRLLQGMPEDIWLKKMSATAVKMAQSGQYNFARCINHNEVGAAQIALTHFVEETLHMCYLLNKTYMPYYKWVFKRLRQLPYHKDLLLPLEYLLCASNEQKDLENKQRVIEEISKYIIIELKNLGVTDGDWDYLEPHGFEIAKKIKDEAIKGLHILQG